MSHAQTWTLCVTPEQVPDFKCRHIHASTTRRLPQYDPHCPTCAFSREHEFQHKHAMSRKTLFASWPWPMGYVRSTLHNLSHTTLGWPGRCPQSDSFLGCYYATCHFGPLWQFAFWDTRNLPNSMCIVISNQIINSEFKSQCFANALEVSESVGRTCSCV